MKQLICLLLVLVISVGILPNDFSYAAEDVPSSWAKNAIDILIQKGAIPEHLQNNYIKPITRLEFSQLLVPILALTQRRMGLGNTAGKKEPWGTDIYNNLTPIEAFSAGSNFEKSDKFFDCEDVDVYRLANHAIIQGTSIVDEHVVDSTVVKLRMFEPNALISRQQASIMMVNAIDWNNQLTSSDDQLERFKFIASYKPVSFEDKNNISNWALGFVTLAVNNELITGTEGNKFDPLGNLTREQAMVMGYRIYTMFTQDSQFYTRVSKANEGYIYDKYEQIPDATTPIFISPKDLAKLAAEKGTTVKRDVTNDGKTIHYMGDLTQLFDKSLADLEKMFGAKPYVHENKDIWGLTTCTFLDLLIEVKIDKLGKVVGIGYISTNNRDTFGVKYHPFNNITSDLSQDYIRKNYKVVREGSSKIDLNGDYRMYLDHPGYMVEIIYGYMNHASSKVIKNVLVLKGNYQRPLDYYESLERKKPW